jgi:transcriptional regulator with XRE-family HTH domain
MALTSHSSWLRAQRLAHGWSIAEMARQLHKAAKNANDNTVASAAIMTSYVRRWEQGKIAPTERYRLHYCTVLGIPFDQYGPEGSLSHQASPGEPLRRRDPDLLEFSPEESAGYVIVVIPEGGQVVINITTTTSNPPTPSEKAQSAM